MEHIIEEKDGILVTRFVGKVDPENAKKFVELAAPKIRIPGNRVKIITDFSQATDYTPAGMQVIIQYAKDNEPYVEKAAVIAPPKYTGTLNLGIRLTGRKNIKAFTSEEEAMKWLKE